MIDHKNLVILLKKFSLESYIFELKKKKYNSKEAFQNFEKWGSLSFFISLLYVISDKAFPKEKINKYLSSDNSITEEAEKKYIERLKEDYQEETLFIKKMINFDVLEEILEKISIEKK